MVKEIVRYTVRPGFETQIVLNTIPGATCELRPEGTKDSLNLFADQEGTIRFYVSPIRASEVLEGSDQMQGGPQDQ